MCSPRNPATSCMGSPKWLRVTPPLPTTTGRRAAVRHHEEISPGRLAPISQAGKTKAPAVVAACPDPQQDPAARYRGGGGGGGAASAACLLQAGAGHGPAGSPHHYLPSLPPKKHFISHHVMVAIANAHALQVPAPTATRRCLGSATAAPGTLPTRAPTPNNTSDVCLRSSEHGLAAWQITRGWELPKSKVFGYIPSTSSAQGGANAMAAPPAPHNCRQGFNTEKLLEMGHLLDRIHPVH